MPVFSVAEVRKGGEVYWPVAVNEAARQLTCIVCPGGDQPWPQVNTSGTSRRCWAEHCSSIPGRSEDQCVQNHWQPMARDTFDVDETVHLC